VNAVFEKQGLQVEGDLTDYESVADSGNRMHRRFCRVCGTPVFSESEARPDLVLIRVGALDDPEVARPAATIWVNSAPTWACIDAGLPTVEQQPPPSP